MKCICSLFLLLSLYTATSAQQVDNALLLDYYQNQKYTEAYQYLKSAYPEPVTDMKALGNLAYTSRMSGNLPDAEVYYLRLFAKDSTNTATLFSLGNINLTRRNNQKALTYYKKILLLDSTNFSVYKQLADLSTTDTINYTKYLQKANSINPIEPDVAYDLSMDYIVTLHPDKAPAVLNRALQADSANLLLLLCKANVVYAMKDYPETIKSCTKLLQSGEKNTKVINWLAISYYKTRQYKLCISTLQLLPDQSQNEATFFYTAMSYRALDDQPNAIVYFQKALADAISANTADYYVDLGDAYDSLHQTKKSLASYQKSLEFKEMSLTYYSIANVYDADLKDQKTALKYYKKYLAAKPDEKEEKKYIDYTKARVAVLEGAPATAAVK